MSSLRQGLAFVLLVAVGCGEARSGAPGDRPPATPATPTVGDGGAATPADAESSDFMMIASAADADRPRKALQPGEAARATGGMVKVGAAKVRAGSPPGTAGRDPSAEMDDEEVDVPAFEIDVLPWAGEQGTEPLTEVTWERAGELCRGAGKRLCHELEWELACEGPEGLVYPAGDDLDEASYGEPAKVVAGSGARAMGTIEEWTAGEYGGDSRGSKAVRGSPVEGASAATRRCARRTKVEPSTSRAGLGFRCCRGPAPALEYKTATYSPPFDRLELTQEEFQGMIRQVPELKRIQDDPQMFSREDFHQFRAKTGVSGSSGDVGALTWKALRWVPVQGEEIVVATGHDGRDGFIVALYQLPGKNRFAHGASYVLAGDSAPIILAYTKNPRHIRWMPCLDCNDGGLITIDEQTGQIQISQRW